MLENSRKTLTIQILLPQNTIDYHHHTDTNNTFHRSTSHHITTSPQHLCPAVQLSSMCRAGLAVGVAMALCCDGLRKLLTGAEGLDKTRRREICRIQPQLSVGSRYEKNMKEITTILDMKNIPHSMKQNQGNHTKKLYNLQKSSKILKMWNFVDFAEFVEYGRSVCEDSGLSGPTAPMPLSSMQRPLRMLALPPSFRWRSHGRQCSHWQIRKMVGVFSNLRNNMEYYIYI